MLMNADEIRRNIGIDDRSDKNFRNASYDVRIGRIILPDGKVIPAKSGESASFRLPPQGLVEVVSKEKINLPPNIAGYAMVKTSLCNAGILPLNIGIIDPRYNGYLSSALLNFSKNEYLLRTDDVFLRLTFHQCNPNPKDFYPPIVDPPPKSYEKYIEEREEKMMNFSESFLNLRASIEQVTDPIVKSYRNWLITIAAALLALYPFIVDWARAGVIRDQVKAELQKEATEKQSALEERIKLLEDKNKIEDRLRALEERMRVPQEGSPERPR